MLKEKARSFQALCLALDLVSIGLAWVGAFWLRFHSGWIPVYFGTPDIDVYLVHLPLVLLVWLVALSASGVYSPRRWWVLSQDRRSLLRGASWAMVLLVSVTYLSTKTEISRIFYACFGCLATGTLMTNRVALRTALRKAPYRRRKPCRVLVVGQNAHASAFEQKVREHPEAGLVVAGRLAADRLGAQEGPAARILGSYDELRDRVQEERIHIVVFALTMEESSRLLPLLRSIEDLPVDIHILPDLSSILALCPGVEDFGGIQLIQIRASPHLGIAKIMKRGMDVVFSLVALVLLSPLMGVIALVIKATSPGSILYRQIRMGPDGKAFQMVKFRTMHVGAEPSDTPVWSRSGDPRRTRFGAFLRRYSLDEMPQLWNVLKGEMSLVGPRPERPEFIREFSRRIPAYMLRYKVKCGLTGLAQIQGWRGATSLEKRIECDIQYIQRWTLGLDLKILFVTLWKGFINRAEG